MTGGQDTENAAVWKRVSTGLTRQEIRNQDAGIDSHVAARGYRVQRTFTLAKSAYKGQHEDDLRATVEDVRAGRYTVIVMAMTSRIERRGWKTLLRYLLELDALGARVEAVDDPNFGNLDDDNPMPAAMTMMTGHNDHSYSKKISDNVNQAFRRMDSEGAFRGCPPPGYMIIGEKWHKKLVPDEAGGRVTMHKRKGQDERVEKIRLSAAQVRQAFKDTITRKSTVALEPELGMHRDGINAMLRNPVYSTGWYTITRADGTITRHHCKPLITPDVQAMAIAAMQARHAGDNVTPRGTDKHDFSTALYCPCGDPEAVMTRYTGGGKPLKDGTPTSRVRRYKCRACGKSVKADNADQAVSELMAARTSPRARFRFVKGDDHSAALDRARLELEELPKRRLSRADAIAEMARLYDEIEHLEKLPKTPARTIREFVTRADGTCITEGEHWQELTMDERRDWLKSGEFIVLVSARPGRTGAVDAELLYTGDEADT